MQKHWLSKTGSDTVDIIVLGWAGHHSLSGHFHRSSADVLCLYDWRGVVGPDPELAALISGRSCRLYAWSFGIWAAEMLFSRVHDRFDRKVAFCGSPLPASDLYGLGTKRLSLTVAGLRRAGMDKFGERGYGKYFEENRAALHMRPLEAGVEELENLARLSAVPYEPVIRWDEAVAGSEDLIFPAENLQAYWGERLQMLPLPHYPFGSELTARYFDHR